MEFYKEKSGDHNCSWGLSQSPDMVSGGKAQIFFNIFKAVKPLTMALKKLYL